MKKSKMPSFKELEKSYGYLDYCIDCGNKFTSLDYFIFNVSHCYLGNRHRYCRCK